MGVSPHIWVWWYTIFACSEELISPFRLWYLDNIHVSLWNLSLSLSCSLHPLCCKLYLYLWKFDVWVERVGKEEINERGINKKALDPSLIPPTGHFRLSKSSHCLSFSLWWTVSLSCRWIPWIFTHFIDYVHTRVEHMNLAWMCLPVNFYFGEEEFCFCFGVVLLSDVTPGGDFRLMQNVFPLKVT